MWSAAGMPPPSTSPRGAVPPPDPPAFFPAPPNPLHPRPHIPARVPEQRGGHGMRAREGRRERVAAERGAEVAEAARHHEVARADVARVARAEHVDHRRTPPAL